MNYHLNIVKGLFRPQISLYQLQKAEAIKGVFPKLILLYVLCLITYATSTYFGIGTETYSGNITNYTLEEYESGKLLLLGGKLISSILYPTLFIWFASIFFWIFLEIPYIKVVIVQSFGFAFLLLGQIVTMPVLVLLDLNLISNPFSFGVLSQYAFEHEYWNSFFGSITLFHLVALILQYYYLASLSEKNRYVALTLLILFYLITWLLTGLMAFIKIPVLF
ncbi:hypothetical protein [Metabacillus sp. B2-18]|uniref:hypothetical protein n=1 Tax=Metabacillus sp. B2-18 TaxID=2897333 RepID=UPI001E3C40BB|nr:hypothetical protein [Metabacillus sp. B2-18]UGB30492.1 hypothetical protein LPC09_22805 [Metabacillus sp. B2-18]